MAEDEVVEDWQKAAHIMTLVFVSGAFLLHQRFNKNFGRFLAVHGFLSSSTDAAIDVNERST